MSGSSLLSKQSQKNHDLINLKLNLKNLRIELPEDEID
jgi:hypothetical protein